MSDELQVVNEALIKLGATPIASLNDAGAQATTARVLFNTTRDRVLSETAWHFALKKVELPEISLAEGEYNEVEGFRYVYQLPDDRIRSLGLASKRPFRLMRDRLWTDDKPAVLVYVFRAEIADWPGYFRDVVVDTLAGNFATAITDSANRAQMWMAKAEQGKVRAMSIDAQQTPPEIFNLMRVYLRQSYNPLASG